MKRVLIVGSGITSALTGYLIRQKILADLVHITIWDKARGPGGRMSTARSNLVPNCKVDLGLQYISTTDELLKQHEAIYQPLIAENLLEPLKANIVGYKGDKSGVLNFVTPEGSSSIVKYLIQKANINEIHYNTFLESLTKSKSSQIEAVSGEGRKDIFDVVVITMPAEQAYELIGRSNQYFNFSVEKNILESISFSQRYALGLFYNTTFNRPFDIKYFDDNDIVRYISFDNVKRNRLDDPISVCVHSTREFYIDHDRMESRPEVVEFQLLSTIRSMFPSWPLPVETKLQKWKYSQLSSSPLVPEEVDGYLKYNSNPLVLFVGDSFVRKSNFDQCIYSAKKGVELVVKDLIS